MPFILMTVETKPFYRFICHFKFWVYKCEKLPFFNFLGKGKQIWYILEKYFEDYLSVYKLFGCYSSLSFVCGSLHLQNVAS